LFSLDGRKVYERAHSGKEFKIDASYLPKGPYILKAYLRNGRKKTEKLIIR
jgi:hypothetical protein